MNRFTLLVLSMSALLCVAWGGNAIVPSPAALAGEPNKGGGNTPATDRQKAAEKTKAAGVGAAHKLLAAALEHAKKS